MEINSINLYSLKIFTLLAPPVESPVCGVYRVYSMFSMCACTYVQSELCGVSHKLPLYFTSLYSHVFIFSYCSHFKAVIAELQVKVITLLLLT